MNKSKYYRLDRILNCNATYSIIIGERSNGKTYAVLEYLLREYKQNGSEFGIIRRWDEDFKGKRGKQLFANHVANGLVTKLFRGEYTDIDYSAGKWYLIQRDENDKIINQSAPIGYAFSLSSMEHDKSIAFPRVRNILFDEFITRTNYLVDEFVIFANTLSTIIRTRTDVKIFMCGNTISKYCPYFSEMGLTNIAKMKKNDIEIYRYGDARLTVAVEFADSTTTKKNNNYFFAFDNPRLSVITGDGNPWELPMYPHLPHKYIPKNVLFKYFIKFQNDVLQCNIINVNNCLFTYIHRKTTELKHTDTDLIYSDEISALPNWRRNITKPLTDIDKKIAKFYIEAKILYSDNEVGEIVYNYLKFCKRGV